MASSANFDAQYAPRNGTATRPRTEEHCTMRPLPFRRMDGMRRRVRSCVPITLTSSCSRTGGWRSSTAPGCPYAALLKTASSLPCVRSSAVTAHVAIEAGSANSSAIASTPSAIRNRSRSSCVRAVTSARQPRAFMVRAASCPMPDEHPVIRMVRCMCASKAPSGSNSDAGRRHPIGACLSTYFP